MKLKNLFVSLFATTVSVATFDHAHATNRTWIGAGAGGIGTNLNTAANWRPNGTPTAADNCTMNLNSSATLTQTATSTFGTLTVNVTTTFGTTANVVFSITNGLNATTFTVLPTAVLLGTTNVTFNFTTGNFSATTAT
ncbi:MAG TPA: hypothetical protein VG621_01355, partial [Candidatus Paceibacterota bacterium]|nr:hypothetical protein [Candidatus Paceibacterota bacterium]